jgi:hypothetical protein
VERPALKRKKSVVDIVWRDRRKEVEAEIGDIHRMAGGEGEVDGGVQFRLRTTAAKNIYTRLDDGQKLQVLKSTEDSVNNTNTPEIQKM